MPTITVDDQTYSNWDQQAKDQGLSVEDWLKQKTSVKIDNSIANPEDLSYEEWQERFNDFMEYVESIDIQPSGEIDWSREKIYRDRINRQLPTYHENND